MRLAFNNRMLRFVTLSMVVVMGILIANKALFLHVHKLNDGTFIEHAHPFNKTGDSTPLKSHSHSAGQFLLFQVLETISFLFFFSLVLDIFLKGEISYFKLVTESILVPVNSNDGRAPPIS